MGALLPLFGVILLSFQASGIVIHTQKSFFDKQVIVFVSLPRQIELISLLGLECNELEKLINAERAKGGKPPYICDPHLRFVAEKHLDNYDEAVKRNIDTKSGSGHDWWVGQRKVREYGYKPCRFSDDNPECMWNKPYVSLLILSCL